MSNLKYKSDFIIDFGAGYETSMVTNYGANKGIESNSHTQNDLAIATTSSLPALPLSKRLSSIFKEFIVGMKLAHIHSNETLKDKPRFNLNLLISNNLRLLSRRLSQIPEYKNALDKLIQARESDSGLWQNLYQDREVTCGFLAMQAKQNIPCYTPPGVSNIYLMLSGTAGLYQYESQCNDKKQVTFKKISSRPLYSGDIVYFKSDNTNLTNLATSDDASILLNIQLFRH